MRRPTPDQAHSPVEQRGHTPSQPQAKLPAPKDAGPADRPAAQTPPSMIDEVIRLAEAKGAAGPAWTTTTIRLPASMTDELRQAAKERDLSVNHLVTAAVREFLPRLIPADELTLTRPPKEA